MAVTQIEIAPSPSPSACAAERAARTPRLAYPCAPKKLRQQLFWASVRRQGAQRSVAAMLAPGRL